ncbi:MAG: ROK family protein, partial [Chloroflexota bacterium]
MLALDLGASRIRAGVVTPEGVVFARSHAATPGSAGPEAVVAACIGQLRLVAQEVAAVQARPVAIGIAAPGPVDTVRGVIIEPPNVGPGFRNVELARAVADALDLPAVLERDTNVAALAEQAFGAARGIRDFLYITVSTGIGGAIVARGELYGGADGMAGEIGHMPVAVDGPPCGCGARGHLEATSSGSGIARIAAARIASGDAQGLAQIGARSGRALDAHAVADAEDDGDRDAAEIMEYARAAFAAATVGLVDVFNPELIVVGGSL